MKQYIATIGWSHYIIDAADIQKMIDISRKMRKVEGYPKRFSADSEPLITNIAWEEVLPPEEPAQPEENEDA